MRIINIVVKPIIPVMNSV